ncbi:MULTISPECIES: dihydrofolate reductase family protein [Luteimonas]|uniref:Dihydrofolate reductase n=1 Tax=Luteimonas chenhongjianii TaxID=2006110 RepID=A0A290XGI2_9GAMM|nr:MULTISPECIES: dihydrofolate reductase family protein [Luteimonas]ATD68240.1 dihydrofolate reductase [Luteimonas chenhongjianii]RPD88083.1 dihydrofolate reductase [Luteimonas sp. 100069]
MRTLVVAAFLSLDGVMQAPGGPDEDRDGGFQFGGWVAPHVDVAFGEAMGALFSRPFELLLGRRTYDIFAAHWPRVPADSEDAGLADLFNRTAKHVATHRPASLDWRNSHALGSDAVASVAALKAQDGPTLVTQGSSQLVRQLLAANLVDELRLLTFPIVLGAGKRLFDADSYPAGFRLEYGAISQNGIVIARYARTGGVETGSFAID